MSEEEADRYRTEAEECRRLADRAIRQPDKEAWLRLAADWLKLAEGAPACKLSVGDELVGWLSPPSIRQRERPQRRTTAASRIKRSNQSSDHR